MTILQPLLMLIGALLGASGLMFVLGALSSEARVPSATRMLAFVLGVVLLASGVVVGVLAASWEVVVQ